MLDFDFDAEVEAGAGVEAGVGAGGRTNAGRRMSMIRSPDAEDGCVLKRMSRPLGQYGCASKRNTRHGHLPPGSSDRDAACEEGGEEAAAAAAGAVADEGGSVTNHEAMNDRMTEEGALRTMLSRRRHAASMIGMRPMVSCFCSSIPLAEADEGEEDEVVLLLPEDAAAVRA